MKTAGSPPQSTDDLRFLNRFAEVRHTENRLPHWQQPGATYFVTFHLGDSLPKETLDQWRAEREAWLKWNPPPWSARQQQEYDRRFSATIENWLDQGAGECHLRIPEVRRLVAETLMHWDAVRHWHLSWVIMPNHVHALFSLCREWKLEQVLHAWKGFSARAVNRILRRRGEWWQKDYFDRIIRDARHFWRCARYIRRNPERARLQQGQFALFEAPFVKQTLDAERSGGLPAAKENGEVRVASHPAKPDNSAAAGKPPLQDPAAAKRWS
ncbi:MAG: transposase [Verrucomicrobia bacterium]|nr:transposase [Verrucomicrobiota bacterium]